MSAVGEIKANRHVPQRNDTAIKLRIKVAYDILCDYMHAASQFGHTFSINGSSFYYFLVTL